MSREALTLESLIYYLDQLTGRPSLVELTHRLQHLQIECAELGGLIQFSDRGYISNLVRAGQWYEIFVFCWRPGQRSPIHDHAGTVCAVRVLQGIAIETLFESVAGGRARRLHTRLLPTGAICSSEDLYIHEISNAPNCDVDLVTLHVYSPPMGDVGIYEIES